MSFVPGPFAPAGAYDAIPIYVGVWANLPAAASNSGWTAVVGDPTFFVAPLRMRSDGTKWRLDGWQDLAFNITPLTGAAGTVNTEQLQRQWTAPAGLLASLRYFEIKALYYKGSTSDTFAARVRIGAGATPLTDVAVFANTSLITTTSRSASVGTVLTATSATQLRQIAQQNGLGSWQGNQSGVVYPQNFTIPDSDAAATVVSCTFQLTTGTDSSTSGQAHLIITGA